jgi:hypothetical protein
MPMAKGWSDIKAWEIDIGYCFGEIEDMVEKGYEGKIYTDAIKRRKKMLGTHHGTIEIFEKDFAQNVDGKTEFTADKDMSVGAIYHVYELKNGDIRVFNSVVPKTDMENHWIFQEISKAIPLESLGEVTIEMRNKFHKRKKDEWFAWSEYRINFIKMNLPEDIEQKLRTKIVLRGV